MRGIDPRLLEVLLETRNGLGCERTMQCANLGNTVAMFEQIRTVSLPFGGAINQITRIGLALADGVRFIAITATRTKGGCRKRARLKFVERATVALRAVNDIENACHRLFNLGNSIEVQRPLESLHLDSVQSAGTAYAASWVCASADGSPISLSSSAISLGAPASQTFSVTWDSKRRRRSISA